MKTVAENRGQGKDIFCAIDLHDKTMLAGIAVDKGEIKYRPFDTDDSGGMEGLLGLLRQVQGRHPSAAVHASYEASGSGFRLSDILEDHGFECWVLAPSHLPVSRKSRSEKTDQKDVKRIMSVIRSHVLAGSDLPAVWKPDVELRDDREIVRQRLRLGEEITKVKNKIHGLLKRNGLRKPGGMKNWTRGHLRWLEDTAAAGGRGLRVTLQSLLRELGFYVGEEVLVDQAVLELSRSARYGSQVKALTRVKGVGVLSAMVYLTELGDLNRFRNRKALGNYLGLTPRSYESGDDDDHKGHISRLGPSRVRKVLNQCAWAAVKYDGYWRDWFEARTEIAGLSAKKKKELRKKMITAVMRRLGIWLWHAGVGAGMGCAVAAA
jgi:transposase